MNCEFCGSPIADGVTECPACGAAVAANNAPVEKTAATAATPAAAPVVCMSCGESNPASSLVCGHCGARLRDQFVCLNCGKHFDGQIKFCDVCGHETASFEHLSPYRRKKYLLLAFLLGLFGVQFFYVKRWIIGVITCLLGVGVGYVCVWNFWYWLGGIINSETYGAFIGCVLGWWLISIILAFVIKTDGKGRKML